jgi:hypothetical protein
MLANTDEASSAAFSVQQMLDALGPAISSAYFRGEHVVPGLQQDLYDIVQNAAHLAGIFRISKADFQVFITRIKLPLVKPPSFGFPFDSETMELVKDVPIFQPNNFAPVVDLAISPGILKTGNADGTNYGSERVLVKLQTVCNLRPLLEFLHGDGMEQQGHGGEQGTPALGKDGGAIKEEQPVHEGEQGPPVWREERYTPQKEQAAETDATLIVVKEELEG